MKKKGGAMLCLAVMIAAIVLMILFVGLIFAFKESFRYSGELVKNVVLLLMFIIIVSAVAIVVLLQREKKVHLNSLLKGNLNKNVCPNCHINLSSDCYCCPNCKTKIRE